MGSLSMADSTLPFMTARHYEQACSIIERVIERLAQQGRHFTGVMNSGFFATADGVKVIEFNARFGDPECMNIMCLFRGNWPEVMERLCAGGLSKGDVPLCEQASLVLYLVSPDYALRAGQPYEYELDQYKMEEAGCHVFFASSVKTAENAYRTVGTSRAVALATTAPTLERARGRIVDCASSVRVLQWRRDVGDESYLRGLTKLLGPEPSVGEKSLLPNTV
jgi:phosphoribosylamine--glycine ligase